MAEECLMCKAPLEYLSKGEQMECVLCHKEEESKTRCVNGHYICNECHTQGIDRIVELCLAEESKNSGVILMKLMDQPFCHMHGPEHHIMVGASLLTAYKNAGGEIDLRAALLEMQTRGKEVPGGVCGFWGCCGAAVSTGIFYSIISGANPLTEESWGGANLMTSAALQKIGAVGGPRCCKRDSFFAVQAARDFTKERTGVEMEATEIVCHYSEQNNQCIGKRCPFHS